jgi:uncharacterized RDD family membrane protein YckC
VSELDPGWKKDPADPTTQRYWDGEGWIGEPIPAEATPPAGPPRGPQTVLWPAHPTVPPAPTVTPAPAASPVAAPPPFLGTPLPYGLPVASLGLRLLARLIDVGIVLGLNVLGNGWLFYLYLSDIWPAVQAIEKQMLQPNPNYDIVPAVPGRAQWILTVIPLVAMALWFAYEVPAISQRGQTLGKRVVGIKVLPLEGARLPGMPEPPPGVTIPSSIGFLRAARRWNPLGLPVLLYTCCGIGFLLQLVDALSPTFGGPRHLAFHDRAAATVVVHIGRKDQTREPDSPRP